MLSKILERVLSVVRMPAGALLLHHGDSRGPTSVVSVGLDESFCRALQEEGLDDYLAQLPVQLDNTVVFRDLLHDAGGPALPNDERFLRFQNLTVGQGLRTAMVSGLRAKDKQFGALLLAAPEGRRLTAAELSLLKVISDQIAMAIENHYLIQQTWRRSEELRALNEIGRALSSTLDPEALLEKISTEVQRLFSAATFYVALYDRTNNELRFELEVAEGVRLPKRSRAMGNGVTEYIARTAQPVLIRENFADAVRKLGAQPQREPGLILRRAAGGLRPDDRSDGREWAAGAALRRRAPGDPAGARERGQYRA